MSTDPPKVTMRIESAVLPLAFTYYVDELTDTPVSAPSFTAEAETDVHTFPRDTTRNIRFQVQDNNGVPKWFGTTRINTLHSVQVAEIVADVWAASVRTLTSITAIAVQIWDVLLSAILLPASIGRLLKDDIDATISSRATQTSVDAIQNNTRFAGIVDSTLKLPTTGTKDYKFFGRLFDSIGNPEDPDSNVLNIRIETVAGGIVVATTAMTRTGIGLYEFLYTVNSTDTEQPLRVFFEYIENSISFNHVRATEVKEFETKLDSIQADTNDIQARLPAALVGGRMDSDVGNMQANVMNASALATDAVSEISADVDTVLSAAHGNGAWTSATGQVATLDAGTAQAGAVGSITLRAGASAIDDTFNGAIVHITSGTGAGQTRAVIDYNGTTKVATVKPDWTTNPDATSVYQVISGAQGELLLNVERFHFNRLRINNTTNRLELFDEAGTTIVKQFALKNPAGDAQTAPGSSISETDPV